MVAHSLHTKRVNGQSHRCSVLARGARQGWHLGSEKALFHLFQAEQGVKMLHKGFSLGGAKCCTRGFLGPKKGFSWLPKRSGPKSFACGAPKSRLRRNLSILRANAAKKKGKFYDAKKTQPRKPLKKGFSWLQA